MLIRLFMLLAAASLLSQAVPPSARAAGLHPTAVIAAKGALA